MGETQPLPRGSSQCDGGDTAPAPGSSESDGGDTAPTPGGSQSDEGDTAPTPGSSQSDGGDTVSTPGSSQSDRGDRAPKLGQGSESSHTLSFCPALFTPSAACQSRPCHCDGPKWLGTCPCLRSTGPKVGLALETNGCLSHHWEKSCGEAEPKITELSSQSRWSTGANFSRALLGQNSVFLPPPLLDAVRNLSPSFKSKPSPPH